MPAGVATLRASNRPAAKPSCKGLTPPFNNKTALVSASAGLALAYWGGIAGGGYTPRRIHGNQLMPNSTSSLAS